MNWKASHFYAALGAFRAWELALEAEARWDDLRIGGSRVDFRSGSGSQWHDAHIRTAAIAFDLPYIANSLLSRYSLSPSLSLSLSLSLSSLQDFKTKLHRNMAPVLAMGG